MQMKPFTFPICRAIAAVIMLWYFSAGAHAQEVRAGDLVITQAWSRATPGGEGHSGEMHIKKMPEHSGPKM